MQVTESTKFLAQEILDYLERFPERHEQANWVSGSGDIEKLNTTQVCNSTMCVAGTAVFLTTPLKEFKDLALSPDEVFFEERGAELLGLDSEEADRLFYSEDNAVALELLRAVAEGDEDKFESVDYS